MPPPTLFSPSTDGGGTEARGGAGVAQIVRLGSVPTRGRSPGMEKRMWVAEA